MNIIELIRGLLGEAGLVILTNSQSNTTNDFYCLNALTETVLSVTTVTNSTTISNLTLPAGATLFGTFRGVSVTTGNLVCYKK